MCATISGPDVARKRAKRSGCFGALEIEARMFQRLILGDMGGTIFGLGTGSKAIHGGLFSPHGDGHARWRITDAQLPGVRQ